MHVATHELRMENLQLDTAFWSSDDWERVFGFGTTYQDVRDPPPVLESLC
jgi:hypothetical protein